MIFIGVDPGASGGIATIGMGPPEFARAWSMPATERDLWHLLVRINGEAIERELLPFLSLEKVGPMPGQGVTSMFSFGQNYGTLRGMIIALCVPFEDVLPRVWQKAVGAVLPPGNKRVKDMDKREKNARRQARMSLTKSVAQQLFPGLRVTHATAAALLIAEACRRKHASEPLLAPSPAPPPPDVGTLAVVAPLEDRWEAITFPADLDIP